MELYLVWNFQKVFLEDAVEEVVELYLVSTLQTVYLEALG